MKILHVINNLATAGAEKLLADILPRIRKNGFETHLLISNGKSNSEKFVEQLILGQVKIIDLNKSFYDPTQILNLITLINKEKYDVIHAHLFPTQYWVAFASCFIKNKPVFIKTEHSVFNERKSYRFLRPLEKLVYSRYDKIIGITDEVTSNLESWLQRSKGFITIHNGVNIEEIKIRKHEINYAGYKFLKTNNYNILMVGRFDGIHKDQMTLINAVENLDENFHLYFAGEGPHEPFIRKQVKRRNLSHRIHFLGVRTDVYALMNLVDLNVLSSKQEGLSGVALESMASSQPFIGSDVSGIRDIVPSQEHLFPAGDYEALRMKILRLSCDAKLQEKLVKDAQIHVQRYDISNMVKSYIELYQTSTSQ